MGLYVNQEEKRSKLQERIEADLRAKSQERAKQGDLTLPDGVEDSAYIKGTKQTTSLAWAWTLIFAVALGLIIFFIWSINNV